MQYHCHTSTVVIIPLEYYSFILPCPFPSPCLTCFHNLCEEQYSVHDVLQTIVKIPNPSRSCCDHWSKGWCHDKHLIMCWCTRILLFSTTTLTTTSKDTFFGCLPSCHKWNRSQKNPQALFHKFSLLGSTILFNKYVIAPWPAPEAALDSLNVNGWNWWLLQLSWQCNSCCMHKD